MGATPPVKGPLGFISPVLVYLCLLPPLTTLTLWFCSQEQQFRVQDRINSFNLLVFLENSKGKALGVSGGRLPHRAIQGTQPSWDPGFGREDHQDFRVGGER